MAGKDRAYLNFTDDFCRKKERGRANARHLPTLAIGSVAMHTTKRGEPLPINGALNRPRTKLGLELSAWMSIVFVTVTVFLAGFKWLAIFSFPCLVLGAWLVVRKHPKMFQLWALSLKQRSYYDPRK